MVRGAHNIGVLGHPSPLLGSLWLIPFSPVVQGQHRGLAMLADGSRWLLVNTLLCMVLIDGVVFVFSFFKKFSYSTPPSAWRREEVMLTVLLISNQEYS